MELLAKDSESLSIHSLDEWKAAAKLKDSMILQDTLPDFNKENLYAVKGDRLIGVWHNKFNTGVLFAGRGLSFSKSGRKMFVVK